MSDRAELEKVAHSLYQWAIFLDGTIPRDQWLPELEKRLTPDTILRLAREVLKGEERYNVRLGMEHPIGYPATPNLRILAGEEADDE